MKTNTLTQLQKQKQWAQFEKNLFYFMIGLIFSNMLHWLLVKGNIITIIY